jgi:hypothetical protein
MNILVVVDTYLGISETFIYNQIRGLEANKKVILCHNLLNQELFPTHIPIHQVNAIPFGFFNKLCSFIFRTLYKSGNFTYPFYSILKIQKIIKEEKIDVIYAHYGTGCL